MLIAISASIAAIVLGAAIVGAIRSSDQTYPKKTGATKTVTSAQTSEHRAPETEQDV